MSGDCGESATGAPGRNKSLHLHLYIPHTHIYTEAVKMADVMKRVWERGAGGARKGRGGEGEGFLFFSFFLHFHHISPNLHSLRRPLSLRLSSPSPSFTIPLSHLSPALPKSLQSKLLLCCCFFLSPSFHLSSLFFCLCSSLSIMLSS